MIQWQYIDMLSMLFLLVAGVEDGPSSVLEMLRKRPQSRTKYTQSSHCQSAGVGGLTNNTR